MQVRREYLPAILFSPCGLLKSSDFRKMSDLGSNNQFCQEQDQPSPDYSPRMYWLALIHFFIINGTVKGAIQDNLEGSSIIYRR